MERPQISIITAAVIAMCWWIAELLHKFEVSNTMDATEDSMEIMKAKVWTGFDIESVQYWFEGIVLKYVRVYVLFTLCYVLDTSDFRSPYNLIAEFLSLSALHNFTVVKSKPFQLGHIKHLGMSKHWVVFPFSPNQYVDAIVKGHRSTEELMKYEWFRYLSFKTFPMDCVMTPMRLSQAGFYYTGHGQEVKCFCCGMTNGDWITDETAIEVHKRLSPNCHFIRGESTSNVPIHRESNEPARSSRPRSSRPSDVNTQYKTFIKRRRSFDRSQLHRVQDLDKMAAAGFFYAGVEDRVRCFYCGIGLRDWQLEDNPWTEHARWSPQCSFLHDVKGETFVQNSQRVFTPSSAALPEPDLPVGNNPGSDVVISLKQSLAGLAVENGDLKAKNESLEKQVDDLRHSVKCKICLDAPVNVVFLPCGHMVACQTCANRLRKCAICRKLIKGTVRTYIS